MKTIEELKAKFKEIDEILIQAEDEFKEIEEISKKLKAYSKKIEILENFYFNDKWQVYREELEKHNEDNFYATSEDAIWNLSVAYHDERLNIVKQLVQEL